MSWLEQALAGECPTWGCVQHRGHPGRCIVPAAHSAISHWQADQLEALRRKLMNYGQHPQP